MREVGPSIDVGGGEDQFSGCDESAFGFPLPVGARSPGLQDPRVSEEAMMGFSMAHGSYELQKFVEVTPAMNLGSLVATYRGSVVEKAQSPSHSRVLERLLQHCPPQQTRGLVDELIPSIGKLCMNAYGNFVMQGALESSAPDQRRSLFHALAADAHRLALDKTASNVIRVALTVGTHEDRAIIVEALVADRAKFTHMRRHKRGSWVAKELSRFWREQREFSSCSAVSTLLPSEVAVMNSDKHLTCLPAVQEYLTRSIVTSVGSRGDILSSALEREQLLHKLAAGLPISV